MWALEDKADSYSLGCGDIFTDAPCVIAEWTANGLGGGVGWFAELVLSNQPLAPGQTLWDVAIGEASSWFGISIIVIMVTGLIGMAWGLIRLRPANALMSAMFMGGAIPVLYIALGIAGALAVLSDQLSDEILKRLSGKDGFATVIRAILQKGVGNDSLSMSGGGDGVTPLMLVLVLLAFLVSLFLMSLAISFRNLGMMVLVAFSPLAFVGVPLNGGWGLVKKWWFAYIALLLSKPLMFGMLAMLLKGAKGAALFSSQTMTVITGLFLVSFMPFITYQFFQFLGAGHEQAAGAGVAGQASQNVKQGGRNAQNIAQKLVGGGKGSGGGGGGGKVSTPKPAAQTGGSTGGPGVGGKSGKSGQQGTGGNPGQPGGKGQGKSGANAQPGQSGQSGQQGKPGATPPQSSGPKRGSVPNPPKVKW